MPTVNPKAAESVFLALLDIGAPERPVALSQMCDGNDDLRREVESLLRFHEATSHGALDRSPLLSFTAGLAAAEAGAGVAATGHDEASLPPNPTAAGFTLTSVLGSGGMGVVYVAEQHRPRRTVALKVLRQAGHGAGRTAMLRRFEYEAEVLARLQHPGIAQIFEAGVADFGHGQQPFIAMELVPGQDLLHYANERGLSVRERLELIASICDAVQHAHQRGVIHRDLKPANILVEQRDEETKKRRDEVDSAGGAQAQAPSSLRLSVSPSLPQPKILDFGVARVMDSDIQATTLQTGVGQLIGTLAYMSPEQVAGEPGEIDTRSDVYALGVILYELLAGRLPHDVASRSIPEAVRAIRDDAPPRLSAVARVFRGDIDTIVQKALEKNPARRYPSAAELAADLRRYLASKPIIARRPSALYQFRKFAERNKRLVASVTIGLLLLLGGAVVSVIFAVQATLARNVAVNAQMAAESQGRTAAAEARNARYSAYLANVAAAQGALRANDIFTARRRLQAADASGRNAFEWRHLSSRLDDSLAVLEGPGTVHALAVAPDGKTFASGGGRGQVFVWSLDSMDVQVSLSHEAEISVLEFSPDGSTIASAGKDGFIRVWDLKTGLPVHSMPSNTLQAQSLSFSADGSRLVMTSMDKPAQVWDVAEGWTPHELGDDRVATASALSPDGALLATGLHDRTVNVRNLDRSGEPPVVLPTNSAVHDLSFDATGQRLAGVCSDHTLRVWDLLSARQLHILRGHQDAVIWCEFAGSGDMVWSASHDGTLRLWDAAAGSQIGLLRGHERLIFEADSSRDGQTIVSISLDQAIRVWDADVARDVDAINSGSRNLVTALAFSPDGRRIASGTGDGIVRLWDADSATLIAELPGHQELVQGVAFTPDGARLVSASYDDTLRIWNLESGVLEAVLRGHAGDVFSVAVAPDGRTIASASYDSTIRLWDTQTHELRTTIARAGPARCVAFSPDGRWLASGGADRMVRLWDAVTGAPHRALRGHHATVNTVVFSRDGSRLASASDDYNVRLWSIDSAEPIGPPLAHSEGVIGVAFMPDCSRLVTGSGDAVVHLWDTATNEEVAALRGHTYPILSLAVAPDGSRMVSGSMDKIIRLWETQPPSARIEARRLRAAALAKAAPVVERLFNERSDARAIVQAIRADDAIDEAVRLAALDLVLQRGAATTAGQLTAATQAQPASPP